jgi:hypothetical protein
MYYYIYKITNINSGKFYIGSHKTNNLDDGYFGSGIYLKRSITLYGKQSFTKEIIMFCENEDVLRYKETEVLQSFKNHEIYNLKLCSMGGNTREKYTTLQKQLYVQKLVSNPKSPIGKRGKQAFNYGKKLSSKTKHKKSKSMKKCINEMQLSDTIKYREWRNKISEGALKNIKLMAQLNSKRIIQTHNQTNEVVIYNSIQECMSILNISRYALKCLLNGKIVSPTKHLDVFNFKFV